MAAAYTPVDGAKLAEILAALPDVSNAAEAEAQSAPRQIPQ